MKLLDFWISRKRVSSFGRDLGQLDPLGVRIFESVGQFLLLLCGTLVRRNGKDRLDLIEPESASLQVELDARFLASVATYPPPYLKYLCLLGPVHRTERVLAQAGIAADAFPVPLQSPAGFNIGGDLPESIALSILSQAHAALYDKPYAQSSYDWQCDSA